MRQGTARRVSGASSLRARRGWLPIFRHQLLPPDSQGFSEPGRCAEKNIDFPRFNSLDVANVEFRQLGQPLLTHLLGHALSTDTVTQLLERGVEGFGFRHAFLVRKTTVDGNGVCAVACASKPKATMTELKTKRSQALIKGTKLA